MPLFSSTQCQAFIRPSNPTRVNGDETNGYYVPTVSVTRQCEVVCGLELDN